MTRTFMQDFWYHLSFGTCCKPGGLPLTPLMQAAAEINQSEFDLLHHTQLREYHFAMEIMLTGRLRRLREDHQRLSKPDDSVHNGYGGSE